MWFVTTIGMISVNMYVSHAKDETMNLLLIYEVLHKSQSNGMPYSETPILSIQPLVQSCYN